MFDLISIKKVLFNYFFFSHLSYFFFKHLENATVNGTMRENELENVCKVQAARIEQLNEMVLRFLTFMNYVCGLDFT